MAVSELPGNPNAVWTVRRRRDDPHDAYIVVSFVNATLVLSIGETVEEVTDSGLKTDTPTLFVGLLGDDAMMQVTAPSSFDGLSFSYRWLWPLARSPHSTTCILCATGVSQWHSSRASRRPHQRVEATKRQASDACRR